MTMEMFGDLGVLILSSIFTGNMKCLLDQIADCLASDMEHGTGETVFKNEIDYVVKKNSPDHAW